MKRIRVGWTLAAVLPATITISSKIMMPCAHVNVYADAEFKKKVFKISVLVHVKDEIGRSSLTLVV